METKFMSPHRRGESLGGPTVGGGGAEDIGPQIVTRYLARGGGLYRQDLFSGHVFVTVQPIPDVLWLHPNSPRKSRLGPNHFDCSF